MKNRKKRNKRKMDKNVKIIKGNAKEMKRNKRTRT
jgi:hypothetical protein